MSTVPLVRVTGIRADWSAYSRAVVKLDQETLERASQDECVVNRLGGARGVMAGIMMGALAWVGLIWAGAALIR
jgi:hypothetical protein